MPIANRRIGDYDVKEEIGRGGVAVVHRAVHLQTGQEVALKILLPQHISKATYLHRFVREGQNASRLAHPNLVRIFEAGEYEGFHYIALELIRGETLSKKLVSYGKPLSTAQIIPIIQQISEGLEYAHNLGFIHRDINLSNILITDKNRVVVSDFGLARQMVSDETTTVFTMADYSVGTPSFMSPEQARGDIEIDQRSDIYSLGVVAYRMFAGRMPFQADSQTALLYKIIYETAPAPEVINPSIPPGIAYALKRVLSKDPPKRYRSAIAFANALDEGQSWIPQMNNRGYSKGIHSRNTTQQPTDSTTEHSRAPSIDAKKQPVLPMKWAIMPVMVGIVISALALIAVLTVRNEFGLGNVQTPESIVITDPAAALSNPIISAIVLKPYSAPDGEYSLNVPDGWNKSASSNTASFDSSEYFARVFVQQVQAANPDEPLEDILAQYVAEGTLVFQSLTPLSGAQVQIGEINGYEQEYQAIWLGKEVFVRLVVVNQQGKTYVIGTAVETSQRQVLNNSFDAVFGSFRTKGT